MPPAQLALTGIGLVIGALMLTPLVYLVLRAFEADPARVMGMIFRARTGQLLVNTAALVGLVLALSTLIALPLAFLVSRTDLLGRRLINVLAVLPLAIPGYVMAFALIGLSGNHGFMNVLFDIRLPRIQGLWGAGIALTLYCFPYLYLNLRAAFSGFDQSLEDSARVLGLGPWEVFLRVHLPNLLPAFLSGWLVIGLYVIGDFGAVALMRYEAFSFVIYQQYSAAFDRVYAAWLALILIAIALSVVWWESRLRKDMRLARVGSGTGAAPRRLRLGPLGQALALAFAALVALASLGFPVAVLTYWMSRGEVLASVPEVLSALHHSLSAAIPAALLAAALALPVAFLAIRFPSPLSRMIERLAFVGYAVPALAFALAFVFFALRGVPWLYQSMTLLVLAYGLSFLALALGPIRASLYHARPRVEEAARSLGRGPIEVFFRVTLPAIRPGVIGGIVLVFAITMKELPIAFLLSPTGFRPLAISMFSRTSEGMLLQAAPYAAAIILFSGLLIGAVLRHDKRG